MNFDLLRRMRAVRVENFYGRIIKDALLELETLQNENTRLRNDNCAKLSDLYDIVAQILEEGHLNTEDLARLRAAWERV